MRPIALLSLSLLVACNSLTHDERKALGDHQQNAALYYERGLYPQAIAQVEKGLELEPDDYKLKSLKGAILLRAVSTNGVQDQKRLDEATKVLSEVYAERSDSRHEPHVLLNYGQVLQKRGQRHLGKAIQLDGEAKRQGQPTLTEELQKQAAAERQLAEADLQQAWHLFGVLIDRGEVLRFAYNHRMQIARLRGQDKEFVEQAEQTLVQSAKAQVAVEKSIAEATEVDFETERLRLRKELRDEELEVRSLLADYHFDQQHHELALEQLNRILQLDPQRSTDYYNRGRVLLALKRVDDARNDFRRFLATTQLPPTAEQATFARRALEQ